MHDVSIDRDGEDFIYVCVCICMLTVVFLAFSYGDVESFFCIRSKSNIYIKTSLVEIPNGCCIRL